MKRLFTIILLLYTIQTFGQKVQCFCDNNKYMNNSTTSCDTIVFNNKSFLYWQYNCDSIWLTLENDKNEKYIINDVDVDIFAYTYRIGFHLIKEFQNSLLFRYGCPANGPCMYKLIDKNNGKTLKEFNQLICIDKDINLDDDNEYKYNFVVYFSENYDNIIVYNINNDKTLEFPFKDNLNYSLIPEYLFSKMTLKNNILTLFYNTNKVKNKQLIIIINDNK